MPSYVEVPSSSVPWLMRHMVVAITKRLGRGSEMARFVSAMEIARAKLSEWGYTTRGSYSAPLSKIKLTSKGIKRNHRHRIEKGSGTKNVKFERLYKKYKTYLQLLEFFEPERGTRKAVLR